MTQFDEKDFQRRAEELRKIAAEMFLDFRKYANEFYDQMQIYADDRRKRARGASPFEDSPIEKIRALAGLRDEGIITEEEFEEQKKKLLDQL